jgi:hypothetical protein
MNEETTPPSRNENPCRQCGKSVANNDEYCPHCGLYRPLEETMASRRMDLYLVALWAALLLSLWIARQGWEQGRLFGMMNGGKAGAWIGGIFGFLCVLILSVFTLFNLVTGVREAFRYFRRRRRSS